WTATESGRRTAGDGSRSDDTDDGKDANDTYELLQRLGHGNGLTQAAVRRGCGGGGGQLGNLPCNIDVSFNNFSFTVQRDVQAVQDSMATRGSSQPQLTKHVSDRAGEPGDTTAAVKTAAAARSRQIPEAAPPPAAVGLLKPVVSVSAPAPRATPTLMPSAAAAPPNSRASSFTINRSGASLWQQQQQPQGHSPPFEPIRRSAASFSASIPTAANTITNAVRPTFITAGESSAARPLSLAAISSPSQPFSGQPLLSPPAVAAAAAADVGTTATRPQSKLQLRSPVICYDMNNESDYGKIDGEVRVSKPSPLYPRTGVVVLETLELEEPMNPASGIIGGGGEAAVSHLRVPLTPQTSLRPSAGNRSRTSIFSRNGDFSVAVTSPSLWGPSDSEFVLSPLNTPASDGPWVEERYALASSGIPFAGMSTSLALTLMARLDMTSGGTGLVSSTRDRGGGGDDDGGSSGGGLNISQVQSAPFNVAMGLVQEQQHNQMEQQERQELSYVCTSSGVNVNANANATSAARMLSPQGSGYNADTRKMASAAAAGPFPLAARDGGGGGGGNAAVRTAVLQEAAGAKAVATSGTIVFGYGRGGDAVIVKNDGGSGVNRGGGGGGGGNRSSAAAHGFQLPGGF
ncbi:hypothetical protein Vretimale_11897, partial [Volvox reticuliferus]